ISTLTLGSYSNTQVPSFGAVSIGLQSVIDGHPMRRRAIGAALRPCAEERAGAVVMHGPDALVRLRNPIGRTRIPAHWPPLLRLAILHPRQENLRPVLRRGRDGLPVAHLSSSWGHMRARRGGGYWSQYGWSSGSRSRQSMHSATISPRSSTKHSGSASLSMR